MSAFTDRLYDQWRRSSGGSGVLLTTGRPARPEPQKAKAPSASRSGPSVRNSIKKGSNHGISKV